MKTKNRVALEAPLFFLYNENHAIVAWFKRGSADEQKANKKQGQNIFVSKAPLRKGSCQRS